MIDLGCGTGITTIPWVNEFDKVIGVELSKPMLKEAKRKSDKVKWVNQDIINLKIKEKADVVTCHFDVLNHILRKRDVQKAFNNIYEILNKDGLFIFDMMSPESFVWLKNKGRTSILAERSYSKEEIKEIFESIGNPVHKLMIQLMYSSGLRVSEIVNLKIEDLKINDRYGYVRQGKGNKDKLFIIADSLKEKLSKYISSKNLNQDTYLFLSNRNKKYNIRSLQQIIKKARKKAKIEKPVSCHTLRHSFATHLIEQGNSISEVQSLLGHKSSETTFTYLHASSSKLINIKSPIDSL